MDVGEKYDLVGQRIVFTEDGSSYRKGDRLFRVPCDLDDCDDHSVRTAGCIRRKRRDSKIIGCCRSHSMPSSVGGNHEGPVPHEFEYEEVGRNTSGRRLYSVPCAREGCGKHSERTASVINRKRRKGKEIFCSIACARYNPDWIRTCNWCDEEFYLPESQLKEGQEKTFCCEECNSAWKRSEEYRGSNHPAWTGGDYDYGRTDTPEYRHWREDVVGRDNYTCQRCGDRGVRLNAHHIIAYALDASLEYVTANGVTLCEGCHKWVHRTENCGQKCDSSDFLLRCEVITESQYKRLQAHR